MDKVEYNSYIADYYNKDACDYESRYWANPVVQQMRQSFREIVKIYPAETMLEIGCGTGLDLVHFAKTHPNRNLYGMDISPEMIKLSSERLTENGCYNIVASVGSADDVNSLFPGKHFDLIYVFFGTLNTVESLENTAKVLTSSLTKEGSIVITFVNKWYIGGILLDLARLRFRNAFARFKSVWGGYSPTHYLPSHCYTPSQVKHAFGNLKTIQHKGYTILHPAWFHTNINRKLGKRIRGVLWKIDKMLNHTFFWRFGEYGLLVFQHR